jgi:hypothetical protein
MTSIYFLAGAKGLSLSGGASIASYVFFKLGITFVPTSTDRLQKHEKRPAGSPSMDRYAAEELACTPPSEGLHVPGLAPRIEVVPARLERRDNGRIADECWGGGIGQHGLVVGASETIEQSLA